MCTDETVRYYDAVAAAYFEEWKDKRLLLPQYQSLLARLPARPRILDLGCGPGCESKRLSDLGAKVVGIDLSTACLSIARRHAPEVTFLQMDLTRIDLPDDSFDAVLDAAVLFHFTDRQQAAILKSMRDVLKVGGIMLSLYRTGDYCGIEELRFDGEVYRRCVNFKSITSWVELVCSKGFRLMMAPETLEGAFQIAWFAVAK
jgi:SAM-dependent methyltransferase